MNNDQLSADVLQQVRDNKSFMAIIFLSPKSPQWERVRYLLSNAEKLIEKGNAICGFFSSEASSTAIACQIMQITSKWKSCYLFIDGVPYFSLKSIKWLDCFMSSLRVKSLDAYCSKTGWARSMSRERTVTMPCRLMSDYGWYTESLGCPIQDQLQAHAVRCGVDQCPNFARASSRFVPVVEELTSGLDYVKSEDIGY